jgi:3,4-dihydroxy 2-butanone 4-phosphate synthase/GTP cyclohydrolase II
MFNKIEEALEELKNGKIIIVCDDEDRENEGDFVCLAEHATPENINFMIKYGKGLVCTPVHEEIAEHLSLKPMVERNTDNHQTNFTVSLDHMNTTTGISAYERSNTMLALINGESTHDDFRYPGHVFPLIAKNGGVLKRPGHTEAAVDLSILCDSKPAGVICEIINEDGTMARVPELKLIAEEHNLKMITIEDLINYRKKNEMLVQREVEINLPTSYGDFKVIGYKNSIDDKEHIAIFKGDLSLDEPILVRLHSECLTGDVFGSCRCDCGPQLQLALQKIEQEGRGIILYLRQEGRGIGLLNKLKAYKLQEQGMDTVDANLHLGYAEDLRDYTVSVQILKDLGIQNVRLMTNNPHKITSLVELGINVVERDSLEIPPVEGNVNYLKTKQEKMGHLFSVKL